MPSCHRRSSAGIIIHYSYSPCKQVAILLSVILLLLPVIVDGRHHASISIRQQRHPIWRRRILGGIPSFILRVPRGGGPVISAVTEEISIDTHNNETTNMMENNDVTPCRTSTTSIATAKDLPLHNGTTYHNVRMEENGEEDSIIAAAVATNDGDVVLDDIDITMTPTTIVSSSKTAAATAAAVTEIQYVTKKDGTMELFNKEKVR
jgi:hypothetical protein